MITLDIRWPLGLIFLTVGAILLGYAATTSGEPGSGSTLNACWGAVLLCFGGSILWLARRAVSRIRSND